MLSIVFILALACGLGIAGLMSITALAIIKLQGGSIQQVCIKCFHCIAGMPKEFQED